ncbi:hypothetical protein DFH09DRAFT_1355661 [Mycena vulgaris]|nr:hypothetical protein DFH09DRAFT_1355661 [Mycena vulgaris]
MTGESSARLSSTPLRRRMHILERASRSFTTAESSTRNGDDEDDMQPLPSPPTSHDVYEEEDEEEEEQGSSGDDGFAQRAAPLEAHQGEDSYPLPEANPWYKPSIPVLIALAPPIGNWLTGGDHIKDLLLLLLLVFYLHQLIEVPWRLYHAARPRRAPSPAVSSAPTHTAARAASELRSLELSLLTLCLLAPVLGATLLRSLASLTSSSATPISWFSTTLFALVTALRPLREFVSRISSRTSTLHAHVHAHAAPPHGADLADLRAHLARLEARLAKREDALYAYVEDAVAPLEKGVRRMERRVGKLRAKKERDPVTTTNNTIFVPAPPKPPPVSLLAWFAPPPVPAVAAVLTTRRSLDPIPEEGELHTSAARAPAPVAAAAPAAAQSPPVLALLNALLAQCIALALWPLWVLLLPVRGALRFLVGAV